VAVAGTGTGTGTGKEKTHDHRCWIAVQTVVERVQEVRVQAATLLAGSEQASLPSE
jgi:hypothetical protein